MNPTAHINHDAVLRARVALLGSGTLPLRQEVAAYRVLVQVSPLAYLPRLAGALGEYSLQFADRPQIALALRAEAVAAARRMHAQEHGWEQLLFTALVGYREQLELMDRQDELPAVDAETGRLGAGGR
ncbi:hypothetical protein BX286_6528 [Streptomyces sp. 3211.6]|uniref:hypothetical protein n=1 Tax=Streptomyces TaxID=1883 RepID=UPI000CBC7C2F|nr:MULTISPECIES: hypothetical protein [Streptomyces]RKT08430.1 hypothetical protein BX286_6528 [Streptomyces sp. 3211.6]RPF29829.1 hypothetical protein EDD96_6373 [Streptomyces sp. Ag109_G2-6]